MLTLATSWTVTRQSPLSMGFPRNEYWIGLQFLSPGKSSWPRDWPCISCIGRQFLYHWATREAKGCQCPPPKLFLEIFSVLPRMRSYRHVKSDKIFTMWGLKEGPPGKNGGCQTCLFQILPWGLKLYVTLEPEEKPSKLWMVCCGLLGKTCLVLCKSEEKVPRTAGRFKISSVRSISAEA